MRTIRTAAKLRVTLVLLIFAGCVLAASGGKEDRGQAGVEAAVARLPDQEVRQMLIDFSKMSAASLTLVRI